MRMRAAWIVAAMLGGGAGCSTCGGGDADPGVSTEAATERPGAAAEGSGAPGSTDDGATAGEGEPGAELEDRGTVPSAAAESDPAGAEQADPADAVQAEPYRPTEARASSCAFDVHRLVIASAVEDRQPVPIPGDVPATEDPVYVYVQLGNAEGPETTARFVWEHAATEHTHEQTMDVGVSPTWRTWVRHRLLPTRTGSWTVRVFDAGGCEAATSQFTAVALQ